MPLERNIFEREQKIGWGTRPIQTWAQCCCIGHLRRRNHRTGMGGRPSRRANRTWCRLDNYLCRNRHPRSICRKVNSMYLRWRATRLVLWQNKLASTKVLVNRTRQHWWNRVKHLETLMFLKHLEKNVPWIWPLPAPVLSLEL